MQNAEGQFSKILCRFMSAQATLNKPLRQTFSNHWKEAVSANRAVDHHGGWGQSRLDQMLEVLVFGDTEVAAEID